jgi:CheY-like chemotaxis protein
LLLAAISSGRFPAVAPSEPKRRWSRPLQKDLPWIFVVDDDLSNREVMKLRLQDKYHLLLASNADESFELLREHGPQLAAILLDINLQGSRLDGLRLAKLIRGILPREEIPWGARDLTPLETPIIFVTAYQSLYSEEELKRAGGDTLICKPVDFIKLNLALAQVNILKANRLLKNR